MTILALVGTSMVLIGVAPAFMPDSYSWVEYSVSESAGQGIENAWIARLGFLVHGCAVLLLAHIAGERWGRLGRLAHRIYAASLIVAATFAHSPWEDVPHDEFEDPLHSVGATGVGFAFTAGVLIVTFRRAPGAKMLRVMDWTAILAAPILPTIMFTVTGIGGLVQRMLFLIGYLWYAVEAVGSMRDSVAAAVPRPEAATEPA